MDSNPTDRGAKPKTNRHNNNNNNTNKQRPHHRIVRKVPPRVGCDDSRNIYITTKSDIRSQQKRCEDLLKSGAKEIYLHCMGFAIKRGLNLALKLINNSEGALSYAINTSTLELTDELHPLCDEDELEFRQRYNSALHIKIYNKSLFDIVIPKLPVQPALPAVEEPSQRPSLGQRKPQQQQQQHFSNKVKNQGRSIK